MVLFKFSNRFSILPVKHMSDEEDGTESITQPASQVLSSPKRTPRSTRSYHSRHKPSLSKLPPFLRIPRELRWMIFDALVASITKIEIDPSFIDPFHALRLSTKGLREEVIGWQRKRPDVINAFPYGCFIPHRTTFVLRIDHLWKKVVKHKTVSGSHVTFKSGPKYRKLDAALLPETKAIKYMTREQAWYSFCRTVTPLHRSKMHLKFEISLPEELEPKSQGSGLSPMPREELFRALAASRYQEGAWASQRLYLQGTIDQLASMYRTDTLAQIGDMVQIAQKIAFDNETWTSFRDHRWEVDEYNTLSYPFDATYWEDEKYKICKEGRDGKDVYEYGGRVMEAVIASAEDMRRGPPFVVQSSIPPLVNEEDAFDFTRGLLQGTTACL
ncbi:uncharacterized protein Bfra_001303 [Botrytis fragariae]|uniref:Uncharacterized protein n=1 Tax=Botrytis fragariae TaxID=1964551 RepID=A0A8H6EM45_9HELO|nr:uncharacterized protein Bfra_001303 [Botrytis fragariae]KAF5876945.1 hypothetical protein Bfra_001303 [Botrytis fragariae]